jgi:hypothetical protein
VPLVAPEVGMFTVTVGVPARDVLWTLVVVDAVLLPLSMQML